MSDRERALRHGRNDDDRHLIAGALDKCLRAAELGRTLPGDFLEPPARRVLEKALTAASLNGQLSCFGGYPVAERQRAVFHPPGWVLEEHDFELALLCLTPLYRDTLLTHPAVMGAVLAQGIRREKIGDIVVTDGLGFVFTTEELSAELRITEAGHIRVACERCDLSRLADYSPALTTAHITVASLRLDAVIAAAYSLSRTQAAGLITAAQVKVNLVPVTAQAATVHAGDLLSLRGHGRVSIEEIAGTTRKGRMRLLIARPS